MITRRIMRGVALASILCVPVSGRAAVVVVRHRTARVATGAVAGTVRGRATGEPLAGAQVEVPGTGVAVYADNAGTYLLATVPVGTVQLRVTRDGYSPITLEVTVPAGGVIHVDVAMTRAAVPPPPVIPRSTVQSTVLPIVHVVSPPAVQHPAAIPTTDELGRRGWAGDLTESPVGMGEPDILQLLSGDPSVGVTPDGVPGRQLLGGTQTLVLLDGLPVWGVVHANGGVSAVTPDAITSATLSDGALSPQTGGRVGGVLELQPRDVTAGVPTGRLAVGPLSSRGMAAVPLSAGSMLGSVLLAGRESNTSFLTGTTSQAPLLNRWMDGVGAVSLSRGATSLRFLAVASRDHLLPGVLHASIELPWDAGTIGGIWTQRLAPGAQLETRGWIARIDGAVRYGSEWPSSASLDNALRHSGASSRLSWGGTTVGASLEQLRVRYRVLDGAAVDTTGVPVASPLNIAAAPRIGALFVEQRWPFGPDARWRLHTGVRATGILGEPLQWEPRVSLALHPDTAVMMTVGYARTHQFVQSLRNAGAPASALVGVDFPVAAGSSGIPVARSDAAVASLTAHLAGTVWLDVSAYARWLAGVVTADSESSAVFATHRFQVVSGRTVGGGAALTGEYAWLRWRAAYGIASDMASLAALSDHPQSRVGHSASVSLATQFDRLTQLRVATWGATTPQLASLVGAYGSGPGNEYTSGAGGDVSQSTSGTSSNDSWGSSNSSTGTTAQQSVLLSHPPAYVRTDVTLVHDWHTGPGGGRLSTFVAVANLFNRVNVAAYVPTTSGATHVLMLTPRSVQGGVSWQY